MTFWTLGGTPGCPPSPLSVETVTVGSCGATTGRSPHLARRPCVSNISYRQRGAEASGLRAALAGGDST